MKPLYIFPLLAFLLLAACGGATANGSGKPGVPLTLTIEPQGAVEPGDIAEFAVTVTALAASGEVTLSVDLPDDLALFSGDRTWRAPMARGEQHRLVFAIRVPEGGRHRIAATAVMRMGEAGRMATRAVYWLGKAPPAADQKPAPRPREGRGVVEYPVP